MGERTLGRIEGLRDAARVIRQTRDQVRYKLFASFVGDRTILTMAAEKLEEEADAILADHIKKDPSHE